MKNAFALALLSCAVAWGTGAGPTTASASAPRPALSDTIAPAQVLFAKKETGAGRTTIPRTVTNVRHHDHKRYTRVVLDLTGRVVVKETKNVRKGKATISLTNVKLSKRAQQKVKRKNFPRAISIAPGGAGTVHIILDLQALLRYEILILDGPDRVAVDLYYANTLIIIDPGHGGKDPGTIGRKGTREKTIVLQISKYLRDLIHKRHKSKVFLTRSKDVFLNLEKRVELANTKKQEWCGQDTGPNVDEKKKSRTCLFISIHVNAHPERSIEGLEIYYFGKASDPQALKVAARENGRKMESDMSPGELIIYDKLNDGKIQESQVFAETISTKLVDTFRKKYKIKNHGVKTAPFYVLRYTAPMPSVLAEVGFLSNSREEKRLREKAFQQKLAEGIYQGIEAHLKAQ